MGRGDVNKLRATEGLPPVRSVVDDPAPLVLDLVAVSPALCPRPPDWSPVHQVCGFLGLAQPDEEWEMPGELAAFLDGGPPPIFITFGSMIALDQAADSLGRTIALLVDAIRNAECRAVIQTRWDLVPGIETPPFIFRLARAPHRRLFPRCAVIVHHGGAGTTQAACESGRPSVIVSHVADQELWGRELHRLGIAPTPFHRRELTAGRLARAIHRALDDPGMRRRAEAIGSRMRQEDGVTRAVGLIEAAVPPGASAHG
jgi:UDP:flavonoid glycosyltransferase YjiC (YdhE family)